MTINNPALAYLADLPDQDRIEFESLGDFTDRYSPVQSIVGSTITMAQPAWDNNTWGWDTVQNSLLAESTWFLANSLSFLDQAGEWYVDPDAGKLYYKPADGVNPQDLDIELPRVETLISVGGTYDAPVSHLEFSGLTFTGTSWLGPSSAEGYVSQQNGGYLKGVYDYRPADAFANCSRGCEPYERTRNTWFQMPSAVQVSAADHITFARNTFRNLGSSGLGIGNDDNAMLTGIGLGASNIAVTGNVFTQVGGHALFVGGIRADAHHPSDPRMTNQDILIENNTISHVAVEYQDTSGILSTYVTRAQIVHNEVRDLAYAIDTGYGWGINDPGGSQEYVNRGYYKYNPLYQTPTTLKDNLIAGNLVHDIKARLRRLRQHLQPLGQPGDGDRGELHVQRLRRRHLSGRGQPLHPLPAQRPERREPVGVHQRVQRRQRHERQHAAGELVQLRRCPDAERRGAQQPADRQRAGQREQLAQRRVGGHLRGGRRPRVPHGAQRQPRRYRPAVRDRRGGPDPVAQLPALPARRPRDVPGAGAPCRRRSLDDQCTRGNVWHLRTGSDDDFEMTTEPRATMICAVARLTYPSRTGPRCLDRP